MNTQALLADCRERFTATLAAVCADTGLRLPSVQAVIRREAAQAFDEMTRLRSREDYQRLRGVTASRISLVHPDDMDLTVSLINLTHALADACERELPRLQLLFMRLLEQNSAVVDQLPVGPNAISIALRGLCDSGEIVPELRLSLPGLLQPRLIEALRTLYTDLTRLLEQRGITPASLTRSAQEADARSAAHDVFGGTAPEGHGAGYAGPGQQSLSEARGMDGPIGRLRARRLQHQGGVAAPAGPAAAAPADPALRAAIMERVLDWLGTRQRAFEAGVQTPLGELRALLPAESFALLETIDLSFDALVHDARLPAPVRASLARLRLPLCKAALLDEASLTLSNSPPRRLLEFVLRLGAGLSPATPVTHAVCVAVAEACARVQREFTRDLRIFDTACTPLAELEGRLQVAMALRGAELETAATREARRELARSRAARAIHALGVEDLPAPVRAFLEQLWLRVLALVHEHGEGERSGAWRRALHSASQLADSVRPRGNVGALQIRLPDLLTELRAGLEAAGTPAPLRERAFRSLTEAHAASQQARALPASIETDFLPPGPARLDALEGVADSFVLRLPPESDAVLAEAGWVDALEPGSWIALDLPGRPRQTLRIESAEGRPRLLVGVSLDARLALVLPARALKDEALQARAQPMENLFESAVAAADRRSAG
ncbi:MAG: DUF1631 family protein [Candidatus Dactylopiibacterium sp.]|nr:DUF1631 family protein [Candidatus Dactylopiibacterium sp.]